MNPSAFQEPAIVSVNRFDFAEIIENKVTKQKSLHAVKAFQPGEVISVFSAREVLTVPTYLTVQTGDSVHITLEPQFLQYINHSCNPNVFFDTQAMELVALRTIQPLEEFSFFYPSTELDMAQPFVCFCGSKQCLQNIRGARHIATHILRNYRLTKFIQSKVFDQ
jgi:SET domain